MQQKGAENVEQAKNTILLVRGTAAEPAALSAFTAAQPDVQLQTISGLDEAGAALERLRPTLIVLQSDAPDAQALHRCAELAETAEAVFLLLVRQEAYGAAWRTLQKHGVCVMTWPMEQAVLTQTLRNLLLLKKSMQTMQAQTARYRQVLIASPSMSAVHAPHSPTSQPFLTDVSRKSLRSISVRLARTSTIFSTSLPLMLHLTRAYCAIRSHLRSV